MTFFGTGSAKMLPFLTVAALACGSVVVDAFVVKRVRSTGGGMPFATTGPFSSSRTSLGLLDVRGRRSGNGGGGGGQQGEHQDRQGGLNFNSYSSFYNKHNRDPDGVASILSQHEPSTNIWGRYEQQNRQQQQRHEQDFERHQQEQHSRNLLYTESGNRRGENNGRGGYNGGGEVYSNKGRDFYNTAANQERRHDRQRMAMDDMDAGRRNGPRVPRLLATHGSSRPENQFDRNGASSNDGGFGGGGPNGSDFAFSDTNRNGRSVASIIANQVQGAVRQPPHLRVAQQYQQSQNQGMTNNRNDGITSQGQFTENFAHSDRHRNGFGVGSTVSNAMQRGGGPGGPRDQQLQQQQHAMEQDQQRRQQQQQQHPQDRQGRQQERRPRMPGSPQPQSPREQEGQQRQERNAFERMVMQQQDQEQQMMQQQQRRQQQSGYNDVDYAPPLQPEHARRLEQQFQQQQQRRQDADREHQNQHQQQQQQQQQQQHLGEPWEQTRGGRFQGGMMMNPQQQQQQQRQRQEQQEQQRRMSGPPGGEPWEQTRGGERGGVGQQGRSGDRRVHQGYNDMDGVGRIASPYLESGRSSSSASGGGVGSVGGVGNFMGVRPPSQREQQQGHSGGGRRFEGPNDPDTRGTARGMNTAQPRGGGFGGAGRQQPEERRHRGGYDNLGGERYGSPGSVGNFVQSSMAAGSPREQQQQQQQQQQREQQQQQQQQEQQQRQQPNRGGGGRSAATPLGPNDSDTRGTTFGLNTAPPQGQKRRFQYNIHHDPRGPGHPGQQRFGPNSGGGPPPPQPNGMPPPMPPMGGTMMIPPLPPPPQFRP